jgi:hypothetical protein
MHLHKWGPWVIGRFGYKDVRLRACCVCYKVRGPHWTTPMHDSETSERAVRAASGETVVLFSDHYHGGKSYGVVNPKTEERPKPKPKGAAYRCAECSASFRSTEPEYLCRTCRT